MGRGRLAFEDLGLVPRLDAGIIWGHGLVHSADILAELERNGLRVSGVRRFRPMSMSRTIRRVYSHDYAPWWHLRSKVRYLRRVSREFLLVALQNENPGNLVAGQKPFRHPESSSIVRAKQVVRERHNPREGDELSHHHVIHLTDDHFQAFRLLSTFRSLDLAEPEVVASLLTQRQGGKHPENRAHRYRRMPIASLICGQVVGSRWLYHVDRVPVEESVQWRALHFDCWGDYESYVDRYRGTALTSYYSKERYLSLREACEFPASRKLLPLPTVRVLHSGERYILDGLHRVSALAKHGLVDVVVKELVDDK